jgi:polo-like kinase 1
MPFIKKWVITSHAIIFRLSTKVVQVYFQDKSELFLNAESRNVIFLNRHGLTSVFPLSSAMESRDKEMIKRLKYTKEVLTTMLQGEKHSPR